MTGRVADNGPAYSFFEYWQTFAPGARSTTERRSWPADVSGPVSERIRGLRHSRQSARSGG